MSVEIGLDIYNAGVRDGLFLDKKEKKYVWALVWDRWFQEKLMPPEHMKAIRESVYGPPRKKVEVETKTECKPEVEKPAGTDNPIDKAVFTNAAKLRDFVFSDTGFDSYQGWNHMGIFLYGLAQDHAYTHKQMFDLWDEWSKQSDKYDYKQQVGKWNTYCGYEKPRE